VPPLIHGIAFDGLIADRAFDNSALAALRTSGRRRRGYVHDPEPVPHREHTQVVR
jgi:hypothetical protein